MWCDVGGSASLLFVCVCVLCLCVYVTFFVHILFGGRRVDVETRLARSALSKENIAKAK